MKNTTRSLAIAVLNLIVFATHAAEPADEPVFKKNKDGSPDARFIKRHEGFVAEAGKGGVDLLLVGDFLTDDWRGNNKNGVKAIIDCVRKKSPASKILLLPVLPWGETPGSRREKHGAVNVLLPKLDDGGKSVKYVDISGKFLAPDGTIPKDIMPDAAHLSDKGYQIWADAVEDPLKELMETK